MSDQGNPNSPTSSSGATPSEEPRKSLREIAEASYDQVEAEAEASEPSVQPVDDGSQPRDERGRFAPKEAKPGEQSPEAPSPEKRVPEAQQPPPEPAPEGSSTRPPDHWSAEFKADFAKLPPEGQAILLNRHREMEADYTRKSQAASGAVNFAQSLAPVFNDPVIQRSLQENGLDPARAVMEWGAFHRRAVDPDPRVRIGVLGDIAQRMGFDPARLFAQAGRQPATPAPALSEKELADPAIRYFADHLGRTTSDLAALRGELQRMRDVEVQRRQAEEEAAVQEARWDIDQFADEKDAQGNVLRPDFNALLPTIMELYRANPSRSVPELYARAKRLDDNSFNAMLAAERAKVQSQNGVARAQAAVRGNARGLTAPVSKPSAPTGNGSLRDALERSADEIGF